MEKFNCSRLKGGPLPHPTTLYKRHIMVDGNDVHETCRMVLKTTAHRQRSTVVSGTTPSGCAQRAPTGYKNTQLGLACQSIKEESKQPNIVSIRPPSMQALDGGLGDYTQWVHSACPHWTYDHSTRSGLCRVTSDYQNKSKTPTVVTAIRLWSWGLHPVGALSVPPLDQKPLD